MEGGVESEVRFTAAADWAARRDGPGHSALVSLDAVTSVLEKPAEAAGGTLRLNPLHHTGPIAILLFVIAFITGVYVTMFYRFGFEASYTSVGLLEDSLAGRIVRAAHRYSSIALVIVSILHGWRTFVMARFQKPRRTAWVTGVVMVAVVWLIGVTGYWLIWDVRAQVLNEALRRVMASFSAGLDFMIDNVLTSAAGSGWPFLLLIFLIHCALSLGVAVLIWFHLRHLARPSWMPTNFWIGLIGGSLVVASVILPLGMLPPLDGSSLVGQVNLDPFFLFLLPLAIEWSPGLLWGGATALLALVIGLPWLLRRRRPAPVAVIDDRCIGCAWCAADCPYDTIAMVDTDVGPHLLLAVVDPTKCVSCGVCLGSCPTQALALEGIEPATMWSELDELTEAGATSVTFTCQRHADRGLETPSPVIVLPCVGMAPPSLQEAATDKGLTVEMVGCPVDDCSYREGSAHAADRLSGARSPKLRQAYADASISMTTAPPGSFARRRPVVGPATAPPVPANKAVPLIMLTVLVAAVSIWISQAVYQVGEADQAAITISVDHRAGVPLVGDAATEATPTGAAPRLTVVIDGETRFDQELALADADGPDTALHWERFLVAPGIHRLVIEMADDPDGPSRVVFDDTVAMEAGESLSLDYRDQPVVVAADAGRAIFNSRTRGARSGCAICHSLEPGVDLVGPSLAGIASRAANSVPGLTAEEYLRQSIVDPDASVVDGYPAGQMFSDLANVLTNTEIDQLIVYLLTLEDK
ncbi:MAG: 4Fe-4S dicluster domain-containing protein [bacterium]|nr:4Fe-4S dicluster domain-containing protein [bacterium]